MGHVNVPGTVSGRLRSSASHARSVRRYDIIRQRHLGDGILKPQDTSTLVIANPECPIRHDKVTNQLRVRGIQYWKPQTLTCVKICDFGDEIHFFHVYSCYMYIFECLNTSCFIKILQIQTYNTTCVSFSC